MIIVYLRIEFLISRKSIFMESEERDNFLENVLITLSYRQDGFDPYPANIYLFKVNKRNSERKCKICPKLIIKTPEKHQ